MAKQNTQYWDTPESIERYAKMDFSLYDIEKVFIFRATELLKKRVDQISILDLGCGGGRSTIPLHNMGYKVEGIDIAENLIKELKKKNPSVKAIVGDAMDMPYKDRSFDIVLFSHNSLDCMYPYSARKRTLNEIDRVLKKKGFFIFSSHVFNFIPFDTHVFRNIVFNIHRVPTLLFKGEGFYREKMGTGDIVDLYAAHKDNIEKELKRNGLTLISHSRVIFNYNTLFETSLRSFLNWERYYLAKKGG
ncbi:MAG TPA: class I SAM-dependent methyltransferase [Patescibacteria group bacterium]|nr:class I SAM-dependent methyltransferase [Patescibacteria group bacterium]